MGNLKTQIFADGAVSATLFEQRGRPAVPDAGRDDQIGRVADLIGAFMEGAKTSLDIAVYDFRLDGTPGEKIVNAMTSRAQAGVAVRIIHDPTTSGGDDSPGGDSSIATAGVVSKPADGTTFLQRLTASAAIKPVCGFKALMHNKYIIRDALSPDASILMGSANFTNDAWGLQEGNIVILHSQDLSAYYATDFQQLWSRGKITPSTGYRDTGGVRIGDANVTVAFTPGESATIVHNVVNAIEIAKERLTIAAMVMSSGPILAAVCEAIDRGVAIAGLYDGPQMDTVLNQWAAAGIAADKAALWRKVSNCLARKNSIPYNPGQPHNFMHAKLIVADDIVVTGSFNFSNHARGNAENTLLVACPAMAGAYDSWIKSLAGRYGLSPTG